VFDTQEAEVGSTANSYAIIAKLATGGMAEIFLARTESAAGVERYVVLKRVLRQRATDIKFVHMFLDEARLAAQLQHPNIAQVFDTGKLGDSYFFTMEYVHGETVRELLHRAYAIGQTIPIGCALTIIAGAAAGLQHAHERVGLDGKPLGIVHRDVSPSNLMISYEGNVKVVDFGVAKATHRSIETQSGSVKGKIGYMAPEQCRGGIVDQRCDLFSLGIVMWELLVGERLFKRATDFESMESIVTEPSPPPSSRRPDVPKDLDAIVVKLLAKAPADRFQNADELLEAIENTAVRAGIALSVPALRRFVRELFGQRPEPWVEMRIREASPEVVTVTGAPLVGADPTEAVDLQLDRIVDLSSPSITIAPPAQPRAPTSPTVSAMYPGRPSSQQRAVAARPSSPSPALAPSSSGPWTEPPSSVEPLDATVLDSSEPVEAPRGSSSSRLRIAIVALVILGGVAAGAVLYSSREAKPVASVPVDAATPTPADDEVARTAPIVDGAPPAVEPADAATARAPDPPRPIQPAVRPQPQPQPPPRSVDVNVAYRAARYADVVASCAASPKVLAANASTCTLSACRQHDADKARRWVPKAPASKHNEVVSSCAKLGTVVESHRPRPEPRKDPPPRPDPPKVDPPKPPKPKCDESDPMACRR
jgi:serine/threonine-protein kinase